MNPRPSIRTALLLLATTGLSACTAALGFGSEVTEVSVVVLNFEPRFPGTRNPRDVLGGTPPRVMADSFRSAVWDASLRKVAYRIVDWRDIDAFPEPRDGRAHDPASYQACLDTPERCPDVSPDIPAIVDRYGILPLIDRDIADELWIFAGPHLGVEGVVMAGPGAVEIDGAYPAVPASRPFAIMGFSSDQGMTDVLYTFCRRVEATVGAALRQTRAGADAWARFSATAMHADTAGVGTCDTPPNSTEPLDYDNPEPVPSTSPAWLSYPAETGTIIPVSAQVWNGPDYRRSYLRWWFLHVPHRHRTPQPDPPANWWPLAFPGQPDAP